MGQNSARDRTTSTKAISPSLGLNFTTCLRPADLTDTSAVKFYPVTLTSSRPSAIQPVKIVLEGVTVLIDRGDPHPAPDHEAPFVRPVPVHLSHRAGLEPHVDAVQRLGNL